MKKILIVILVLMLVPLTYNVYAQDAQVLDKQEIVDQLTDIDPNIKKWFPRWKICEADLQVQIYNTFLYKGYDEAELDQTNITVLAAPKEDFVAYTILEISCGGASMNTVEIDANLSDMLIGFMSGDLHYSGALRGYPFEDDDPKREYCYEDIPATVPLSPTKAEAIIDYLQPTNKSHVFLLSLFEQSVKIGKSGFWLKARSGNDDIGYPFWYSGQNSITLQRPLYLNKADSRSRIPYLINIYLGGGFRHKSGIGSTNGLMSWVPERTLNSSKSGYFVAGMDFHFPAHPEAGIGFSASLPLRDLEDETIEPGAYGITYPNAKDNIYWVDNSNENFRTRKDGVVETVPILASSGKISMFYHLWLNPQAPENYFRFDLGINYCEVNEYGLYYDADTSYAAPVQHLSPAGDAKFEGLKMYKPETFKDWIYFKAEYRNQAVFPFGASAQISNGIFLGEVWIPLFGDWFYLEGKYSTPMRDARPYEIEGFYMISPVIKLSI